MATYKHLQENNDNMVKRLIKFSGLDAGIVQNFIHFSGCMVKPSTGLIDKEIFVAVLARYFHLYDRHLAIKLFSRLCKSTYKGERGCTVEDFCLALCTFYTEDLDKRINSVFWAYDVNDDGYLDYYELQFFIKACHCVSDTEAVDKEETFNDLLTFACDILGINPNTPVDLEIFREKVRGDTLILHLLGQILPTSGVARKFKAMIQGKTYRQMRDMFGNIRYELLYELPSVNQFKYYPVPLDYP